MPEVNLYHEIPYITGAMEQSHPDRLATVATLLGMTPAPVTACRVLELGCGSGGNIIPMAYFLPGSRFVGVDLAENPIAEGRRVTGELGLSNIDLMAMDLCDIGPDFGEFDYIIAAGVYSWVPAPVRQRLLAICRERLAPQGVAFINYNALPGRHVRIMLRDMMMYHTRDCATGAERIKAARDLLTKVADARLFPDPWQPMLEQQIRIAMAGDDGWFFHDDLSPSNDAFYFRDFIAAAAEHSLQYVGDAQPHLMFNVRDPLDWVQGGVLEREQYFDFLCLRQFRQTLLCHKEVTLHRPITADRMDRLMFCSPARQTDDGIQGLHSVCIADPPETVASVAGLLGEGYPQPIPFDAFLEIVDDRESLRAVLLALVSSGFAEPYLNDLAPDESFTSHPKASRLTRWESAQVGIVTGSNHVLRKLDPSMRALIDLLDGNRDLDAIAAALAQTEGAPPLESIRERLPDVLLEMARAGLLEP